MAIAHCLAGKELSATVFQLKFSILLMIFVLSGSQTAFCNAWTDAISPTAVQVLTTLHSGTGSAVVVEDEVLILTNSHILLGEKHPEILIPVLSGLRLPSEVVFDSPLADIALIRPKWTSTTQLEKLNAKSNAVFCKPELHADCPTGYVSHGELKRPDFGGVSGKITSVLDRGLVFSDRGSHTRHFSGFNIFWVADTVISGFYSYVLTIRAWLRPGMSGSPFTDQNGYLTAMMTSTELNTSGWSYAIPIDEIAKVIAKNHLGSAFGTILPASEWTLKDSKHALKTTIGKHNLIAVVKNGSPLNIGGDTGHAGDTLAAGGDTGHAGESAFVPQSSSLQNSQALLLGFHGWVSNPFLVDGSTGFSIDGAPIAYFLSFDGKTSGKLKDIQLQYVAPTLARFIWLTRHPHFSVWQAVPVNSKSLTVLTEARHKLFTRTDIGQIFVRVKNQKSSKAQFEGLEVFKNVPHYEWKMNGSPLFAHSTNPGAYSSLLNKMGFEQKEYWDNPGFYLDVQTLKTPIRITIPIALNAVQIQNFTGHKQTFTLRRLDPTSTSSARFSGGGYHVIVFFSSSDIRKVDQIIVASEQVFLNFTAKENPDSGVFENWPDDKIADRLLKEEGQ